jgi:hypothetical protein
MIMNKRAKVSIPTIIEPDYDEGPPRRKQGFKKIWSIHQSKYHPIPCPPPSLVSGLQYPAKNLVQSSIPHTITIIVKNQRPIMNDCIETESSSNGIKRKRASTSSTTIPQKLVKRLPLFYAPLKMPSSPSSGTRPTLGKPLAAAPSLPRLAAGRAIPKLLLV